MTAEERRSERLRVRSSIDELPPETREHLEELLSDVTNGLSYRDMSDIIEEECGKRLSTSAICRYAKRYMREVKRVDMAMERLRMISDYAREHSVADASAYINALIQDGLMRRILDGQDDIDDMSVEDAIKYSIQAQRAAVYEYRYKDKSLVREEADGAQLAAERMEWLRSVLRDKPELLMHIQEAMQGDEMVCTAGNDGDGT